MKKQLRRLIDWIYPKSAVCMGCGMAAGFSQPWLCEDCRRKLARSRLGARMDAKLDGMAAAYPYKGPAGGVVRRMKFGGATDLAELMADAMIEAYSSILPTGAEIVTAVPMHPKRLKRRGFNHAEVLARAVAERLELPYESALTRTRNTRQQAALSGDARRHNLKDAFCAETTVLGKRVLLVDDVYTTGETARECARALRAAGAQNVYLLVFALGGE